MIAKQALMLSTRKFALAAIAALTVATQAAHADEISVTQWGTSLYGLPYAVAMDKGLGVNMSKDVIERAIKKATGELEQDLTRHIGDLDQKIALLGRRGVLARELRLHLEAMEGAER